MFVSTSPAELIVLSGNPTDTMVPGAGNLLRVSNTESDVFRPGEQGRVY